MAASKPIRPRSSEAETQEVLMSLDVEETLDSEVTLNTSDTGDTPEAENSKDDAVTFSDPVSKTPAGRKVKVCLNCNHSCSIGGIRYNFEKGKSVNVPEGVKEILKRAGLLMPF